MDKRLATSRFLFFPLFLSPYPYPSPFLIYPFPLADRREGRDRPTVERERRKGWKGDLAYGLSFGRYTWLFLLPYWRPKVRDKPKAYPQTFLFFPYLPLGRQRLGQGIEGRREKITPEIESFPSCPSLLSLRLAA